MTTGHKHKDLILAWASGAIIQFRFWTHEWSDCENNRPSWDDCVEYRIKPEPTPDYYKFIGLYENKGLYSTYGVWSAGIEYVTKTHPQYVDYQLVNKLELIFDGETKELKDVKIHGKK